MYETCHNCGGWKGLHHYETQQCPEGGVEAPIGRDQNWEETIFEARHIEITVKVMMFSHEPTRKFSGTYVVFMPPSGNRKELCLGTSETPQVFPATAKIKDMEELYPHINFKDVELYLTKIKTYL